MLEQRSEILSHYRRLDFFFFFFEQSPVPIYRKRAQIHVCQMATYLLQQIIISGPCKAHWLGAWEIPKLPGSLTGSILFWMQELLHAAYREGIVFEPAPQESLQVSLPVPPRGSCYLSSIPLFLSSLPSSPQRGTPSSQGHRVESGMIRL